MVPAAANETVEFVPPREVRIKGEPAKAEHDCPTVNPAQLIFAEPGPRVWSTKSRVVPRKVMN
jgi:hypothetical protein